MNAVPVFASGATGSIAENSPTSMVAYDANATDDGENSGTLIFSLSSGGDNDLFNINATTGEVTFKVSPDFESAQKAVGDNTYNITVHANDGALDTAKAVTITVTDMNAAPVFASGATGSIAENSPTSMVAYDANATDDGENSGTLTYSLSSGGDNDLFNINAATGEVTFKVSPDFESPQDAGGDNTYNIVVHSSDGVNDVTKAVAITVTNLDELAPVFDSGATAAAIDENSGPGQVVYTAVATDPVTDGPSNPVTYSFGGGADDAFFSINSATGEV